MAAANLFERYESHLLGMQIDCEIWFGADFANYVNDLLEAIQRADWSKAELLRQLVEEKIRTRDDQMAAEYRARFDDCLKRMQAARYGKKGGRFKTWDECREVLRMVERAAEPGMGPLQAAKRSVKQIHAHFSKVDPGRFKKLDARTVQAVIDRLARSYALHYAMDAAQALAHGEEWLEATYCLPILLIEDRCGVTYTPEQLDALVTDFCQDRFAKWMPDDSQIGHGTHHLIQLGFLKFDLAQRSAQKGPF